MAAYTSRRAGSFVEQRRRCNNAGCSHEDKALVRPAEVVVTMEVRKRTNGRDGLT